LYLSNKVHYNIEVEIARGPLTGIQRTDACPLPAGERIQSASKKWMPKELGARRRGSEFTDRYF